MGQLSTFTFVTVNGLFEGPNHDLGWHVHGAEENAFAAEGLKSESTLLFGRVTYQMMASYWPTPMAAKNDPVAAAGMNASRKVVFSRTLEKAEWSNTTLVSKDIIEAVRAMKSQSHANLTLLGSGSILSQFADAGLVDSYQIMVDPVALGHGTPIFKDLKQRLKLRLASTRSFKSGTVLLTYQPAG
jgi:dihydrofolate reductase